MADNLDDIYDGGNPISNEGDPPVTPPVNQDEISSDYTKTSGSGLVGRASNLDVQKYAGYVGPIYEQQGNLDIRRGKAQSATEKWANFAPRTVGKALTGIIEGVGYIGELFPWANEDGQYSNDLTRAMEDANHWLDETMPIYRTTEGTWGASDLGWWLQNAEGLISSVASFAVEGAGIAKIFGAIGKAAKIGKMSKTALSALTGDMRTGVRLAQRGEQLMTAGMLAYTEGAMSGKRVFDEVYKVQYGKLLKEGVDPDKAKEQAKHTASQSARTAVQLNTTINTGMNMLGGVNMFFNHNRSAVMDAARRNLFARNGESARSLLTRLEQTTGNQYARELGIRGTGFTKAGTLRAGREAVAEGVEEMTNQFSERTGIEEGRAGKVHGFLEQFAQIEKYFDRTMDSEGALNFVLGAIGGPAQGAVTNNIPLHKVETGTATTDNGAMATDSGAEANTETDAGKTYLQNKFGWNRVSARTRDRYRTEQQFMDVKTKIQEDIQSLVTTEEKIDKAILNDKPLEAEKLVNDYFNTLNMNSVMLGFSGNLAQTYENIAKLDNTKTDTEEYQEKLTELNEKIAAAKLNNEDTTELEAGFAEIKAAMATAKGKTAAQLLNFAANKEDNTFQEKAKKAATTLRELQQIYDNVQSKYGPEDPHTNVEQKHVADLIYSRSAELHMFKKYKAELEAELAEKEADEVPGLYDNEKNKAINRDKITSRKAMRYNQIVKDMKTLKEALEKPTQKNLDKAKAVAERNGVPEVLDGDAGVDAFKTMFDHLSGIAENAEREIKEEDVELEKSPAFQEWKTKNPEGNFGEFLQELGAAHHSTDQLALVIEEAEDNIGMRQEFLSKITDSKTMTRVQKNTANFFEKLNQHEAERHSKYQSKLQQRILTEQVRRKATIKRLQLQRKNHIEKLEKLQLSLKNETEALERNTARLQKLHTLFDQSLPKYQEIATAVAETQKIVNDLMRDIAQLESALAFTEKELDKAENQEVTEDDVTEDTPPVEEVPETTPEDEVESETAEMPEEFAEPAEATNESPETEAIIIRDEAAQAYYDEIEQLGPDTQEFIERVKFQIIDGGNWTLNALSVLELMDGGIEEGTGPKIMQLMKEHIDEINGVVDEAEEVADTAEEVVEDVEKILDETSTTVDEEVAPADTVREEHVGEPIEHDEVIPELVPLQVDKFWDNKKQLYPSNAMALMTMEYVVLDKGDSYKSAGTRKLNPDTNPDVLNPEVDIVGQEVTFVIDREYDGPVNRNSEIDGPKKQEAVFTPFSSYEDGKSGALKTDDKSVQEVPIKMVDKDGNTLGWLHEVPWITATNEDTSGEEKYRNTVDVIRDEEGNVIEDNNVEKQALALTAIRKAIVEDYNNGNPGITSTISEQSPGMLQFTDKADKASVRIKGNVPLGIAVGGVVKGVNINDLKVPEEYNNRPVAVVPMPNGTHRIVTLTPSPMSENSEILQSMVRIFELHMTASLDSSKPEIDELKKETGFDISTYEGLRNYMVQYYTYLTKTSSFIQDSSKQGMRIDISPKIKGESYNRITITTKELGNVQPVTATLNESNALSPEFRQALASLLDKRYRAVALSNIENEITGVNDTGQFKEPVYNGKEWRTVPHESYNAFALNGMTTKLTYLENPDTDDGSFPTKDSRGREKKTWVYGANPVVKFNTKPFSNSKPKPEPDNVKVEEEVNTDFIKEMEGEEMLPDTKAAEENSNTGTSVTRRSLVKLRNLVAVNKRNGKTVSEVLDYYKGLGTNIPEGHNPFEKC